MTNILLDSINFCRRYARELFSIMGPVIIAMAILSNVADLFTYQYYWVGLVYALVSMVLQTYFLVRLIRFFHSVVSGVAYKHSVSFSDWIDLLSVSILYGLAVVIGSMALIIPGVFFAAKYGFSTFETVLNDKGAIAAMSASWRKSRGFTGKMMLGSGLIVLLTILLTLPLAYLQEASFVIRFTGGILIELISSVLMLFTMVFYFRVYTLADKSVVGSEHKGSAELDSRISGEE
ncbi:hypothetical protein [Vibrio sp. SCSIO 43137]|uniref:hypothetical protein n=1 Tax=Vibrio sp. SCSIO 43137 TaxID=3021011 RepID=UPI002307AD02|nr:hypothetical protein [Vibrio sp. SCSIO 43137]WCE31455.1 hypothetical protein PK654_20190 [Vibrio sp. SCSIO 43137]